MVLEWIRKDPTFSEELKEYLFTDYATLTHGSNVVKSVF